MSFPNDAQNAYQQPPLQEFQQQAPMQKPNNFMNQPHLQSGHMNATPPPMQQQHHQAFQPYAQQAQYPPIPNAQQQPMSMNPQPVPNYAPTPPLAQGQGFAPPVDNGQAGTGAGSAEAVNAGDRAAGKERKSGLVRAKMQFKSRDIWVGGESHVGRRSKDGEWNEARGCSVM